MNTGVDERQKFEGNPQFDRKPIKLPDDLSVPFSQNCHSTTTSNMNVGVNNSESPKWHFITLLSDLVT